MKYIIIAFAILLLTWFYVREPIVIPVEEPVQYEKYEKVEPKDWGDGKG